MLIINDKLKKCKQKLKKNKMKIKKIKIMSNIF